MLLRRFNLSTILLFFSLLLSLTVLLSITIGPMDISIKESFNSFLPISWRIGSADLAPHIQLIIHEIRLPRTLLCLLIGATLAICGTVMQGLFRNPLAEPGIIGVSAGSTLGAAIAIVLFADMTTQYPILMNIGVLPMFAFLGGVLTTITVYKLGTSQFGTSVTIMLLAGVAISALSGAGIAYLNFIATNQMLRDISLWSMGSVASASWSSTVLAAATLAILMLFFTKKAMPLNALLLGEAEATHLGIKTQPLKRQLIILTAAGVGISVSIAGAIGFIGLMIPHLGRMLIGPDHRSLLPLSALLGAFLLTMADMLSRVVVAPAELPVGIITALIGAPFFLYLLFQQKGKIV